MDHAMSERHTAVVSDPPMLVMCTIPPALLLSSGAPLHWPENNDDFEQPDTEKKSHREARWDLWKFKTVGFDQTVIF